MTIRMLFAASLAAGVLSAVQATDFAWRAKWIAGAPEIYADTDMTGARWIASGKDQKVAAKFSKKFTFKGVEHSFKKLCYYYKHLGPDTVTE